MKRPFAVIGITYMTAQAVAAFIGGAALASGLILAVVTLIYLFFTRKPEPAVRAVLITASVAILVSAAYTAFFVSPFSDFAGQNAYVSGKIAKQPEAANGRYYYVIDTDSIGIDGVRQKTRMRLSSAVSLEADYADTVSAYVSFNKISSEGVYSNRLSLLSRGIKLTAYLPDDSDYSVTPGKGGIYGSALGIRSRIIELIDTLYTDESGAMLKAMITSDESYLSYDTLSDFRAAGISHILAVSGFHMSLISAALVWFLRRLHLGRRLVSCIVCACVWFYIAIAGFPLSAMRAGIMISVMLFGVFIDRLHTPLNSLGFAVLVICLFNPYACVDIGLLLSVSATLGLIAIAPALNRRLTSRVLHDRHDYLSVAAKLTLQGFVTSLTASLAVAPVTALVFNHIPLLAPVVNAVLSPFIMLFLPIGIICVILSAFGPVGQTLAYPLMTADWALGKLIRGTADAAAEIPGSVIFAGKHAAIIILCLLVLLLVWLKLFRKYSRHAAIPALFAVFLCVSTLFASFMFQRFAVPADTITVFDAGDSTSVLVRHRKSAVLIGAGGSEYDISQMYNELNRNGTARLSALVLPELTSGFASHADTAAELLKPADIFCAGGGVYDDLINAKFPDKVQNAQNSTVCVGGAEVTLLSDSSGRVWTKAECGDLTALIAPDNGNCLDCPFERTCDILVLCEDTPANLTAIEPKAVVICSDAAAGTRDRSRISARGFQNVFSTGSDGSLSFSCRDGDLYIGGTD